MREVRGARRSVANRCAVFCSARWADDRRPAAGAGLRTTTASGRAWLPGWSWLGWTIAEHIEFDQGERQLPTPPPAPARLVIVACGARKADCFEAPAGQMYTGRYHRAARRAADAIAARTPGTRVMILSAMYGLVDLDEPILRYEMRLGHRYAITAEGLREQAEQLGLLHTTEVAHRRRPGRRRRRCPAAGGSAAAGVPARCAGPPACQALDSSRHAS